MLRLYVLLASFIGLHFGLLYGHVPTANLIAALSGSIALSCMTLSVCLAARWAWFDAVCGGPDRSYRLHRWLGYGAIIGTAVHWPLAEAVLPGAMPDIDGVAGVTGFYAAIVLIVLALVSALKLVPYHWWKKSHFLMGPVYLLVVFHSLFSALPFSTESHVWWVVLAVSVLGIVAWLSTLVRHLRRSVVGEVIALSKMDDHLDVMIKVPAYLRWVPGQFVNIAVKRNGLGEYHPFSIASAPGSEQVRFIIKASGDFTQRMHQELCLGDKVMLKEVAGNFQPQTGSDRKVQVWAAAGVGVTPFLASLDAMTADSAADIHMLYCCGSANDNSVLRELEAYEVSLPQFKLHVFTANKRLRAEQLNDMPELCRDADLYLCGPQALKKMLVSLWQENASSGRVYHEDFDFRSGIKLPSLQYKFRPARIKQKQAN